MVGGTVGGMVSSASRQTPIMYGNAVPAKGRPIDPAEFERMREAVLRNVVVYYEFPALLNRCSPDELTVLNESELPRMGLPSIKDYPEYVTFHPPYVKLRSL